MAHQIKDSEQEYQYTGGFTTPSGHEFHYYDTPKNERFLIKHASGSHIEFKADGSVIIKSLKDLHLHSSIVSDASESKIGGSDTTTQKIDTNYTLDVTGTINIKCKRLNVEVGETGRVYCGTDLITNSNNMINKATESIALEAAKSVYVDTDEMKTRAVTNRSELGTKEDKGEGGINIMNVYGNAVIRNLDENGGITIASKGYLNLVAGNERVDLTGTYTDRPSSQGQATYTHKIRSAKGSMDKSGAPGDGYVEYDTNYIEKVGGFRKRTVALNENVDIGLIQRITALEIYLN